MSAMNFERLDECQKIKDLVKFTHVPLDLDPYAVRTIRDAILSNIDKRMSELRRLRK